jgi:hypothetical protein
MPSASGVRCQLNTGRSIVRIDLSELAVSGPVTERSGFRTIRTVNIGRWRREGGLQRVVEKRSGWSCGPGGFGYEVADLAAVWLSSVWWRGTGGRFFDGCGIAAVWGPPENRRPDWICPTPARRTLIPEGALLAWPSPINLGLPCLSPTGGQRRLGGAALDCI